MKVKKEISAGSRERLRKIHERKSEKFLKYGVLVELMLSMYSDVEFLSEFDPNLLNKHKNLKANWERVNKRHFDHVEKNYPELLKEYYAQIEFFERIFASDWTTLHFEASNNRSSNQDPERMGHNGQG